MSTNHSTLAEIIKDPDSLLVSIQRPDEIPDKYQEWILQRSTHFCGALIQLTGEVLRENTMNAVQISTQFHNALSEKFIIIDAGDGIEEKVIFFPYRSAEELKKYPGLEDHPNISNPEKVLSLDKSILHPNSPSSITNIPTEIEGYNVDVLPGFTCESESDIDHAVKIFLDNNKRYIFKKVDGTDGNGITRDIEDAKKLLNSGNKLIIEEYVEFEETISIQYLNEFMGVLRENPKQDSKAWLGNEYDQRFQDQSLALSIGEQASEFVRMVRDKTGEDPVIFGLDFGVINEDGHKKVVLIDPNMRMPGNIFMYYQKYILEKNGFNVPYMRSLLLYQDEVFDGSGIDLQSAMNAEGISLIKDSSINTSSQDIPHGGIIIIQDPGEDDSNKLTMVNFFGENRDSVDSQIDKFRTIVEQQQNTQSTF